MKHFLSAEYPSVAFGDYHSYGGSQQWCDNQILREVGCGVIAAVDLLIYLCRRRPCGQLLPFPSFSIEHYPLPFVPYRDFVKRIQKRYFPLIPHFGINGLFLAIGVNALFRRAKLPYRAQWAVPYSRIWDKMAEMLDQDIPVVFSVGPNFPLIWQKNMLPFYLSKSDGSLQPGAKTRAHYVVVTGMDEQWLQISSWGKKYYISRQEYLRYVRKHSSRLTSNILYIRRTDHGA
ncbi:MAG: hypothetical protein IKI69_06180 [Oscillospiraceae bacterium]|nr:hypothetical protein [Oscillospiraceae bacterium]